MMDIDNQDENLKRKFHASESVNKKLKDGQHLTDLRDKHIEKSEEVISNEKFGRYIKAGSTMIIWIDY